MPWSASDYPSSMKNLDSKVRRKAIEIANAIVKDGGDEGVAIATGISRAKKIGSMNKVAAEFSLASTLGPVFNFRLSNDEVDGVHGEVDVVEADGGVETFAVWSAIDTKNPLSLEENISSAVSSGMSTIGATLGRSNTMDAILNNPGKVVQNTAEIDRLKTALHQEITKAFGSAAQPGIRTSHMVSADLFNEALQPSPAEGVSSPEENHMANAKKAAEPDFQNEEFVVEANPVTAAPEPIVAAPGDDEEVVPPVADDTEEEATDEEEETEEAKIARWRDELEGELSNEATITAVIEFLQEEDYDLADVKVSEGIWGWSETADCATIDIGNKDYMIFPNEDTAEAFARALVMNDLENEPGMFTQSWLSQHVDEDKLRDYLSNDVEEQVRESPESYGYEPRWRVTLTGPNGEDELVPGDFADESDADDAGQDAIDEKNADLEEGEEEWVYTSEEVPADEDDSLDAWAADKAEEVLRDPVEYLEDIYGKEDAAKQIADWGFLDLDAAADDAIATDGWQHFVASYDGNSNDLSSGGVWVRHN